MGIGLSRGDEVVFANRALLEMHGYDDLEEFLAVPILDHVDPSSRDRIRALRERRARGESPDARVEYRIRRRDGTTRDVELAASTVTFDGEQLTQSVFKDITERARAEDALREADRRKSEFLAVLSHELRNPLSPIRNSLYILDRATPGGAQARRAQEVIDRQVSHLTRLVDDLLDVTRISRGKIRLQRARMDLAEVIRGTLEDHRAVLDGRDLAIDLPEEAVWVDGDPTRLAQVVGNLLTNAVKFTPEVGSISLSLRTTDGLAVLAVSDTGIGIDPDTLPRLFEPFAQADRTSISSSKKTGSASDAFAARRRRAARTRSLRWRSHGHSTMGRGIRSRAPMVHRARPIVQGATFG